MTTPPTTSTTPRRSVVGARANANTTKKTPTKRGHNGDGDDDDDDEDAAAFSVEKNDGDADTIVVMAHVKDKIIPVHCGFGTQQVAWLGHVAIARYDEEKLQGWRSLGVATRIVKDAAEELPLGAIIYDVLQHHSHVYITTSRS